MTPLISIIVPVYNVETYLTKCVDLSLINIYTKLFSSLNEICFKGFPDVRWNFIFGRLSLYFQCKEFDRKAKLVSILDFFYSLFFPKTPSYNIEKKGTKGILLLNN